jgi:hypothetical protein
MLPTQILYETLFFDFDDKDKPENAQLDTIKLVEFFEKIHLPYIIQFSGSKGFHVFLYFIPTMFDFQKENKSEHNLLVLIRGIFRWFKRTLSLRTLDNTVGEPKKLCRLPYTFHVNRTGVVSDKQCVPLRKYHLEWDINRIIEYSKQPQFFIPEMKAVVFDIASFMKYLDITLDDSLEIDGDIETKAEEFSHNHISNVELKLYLDQMAKHKPCIVSNLQTLNPDHSTRVAFALYMKRMGISKDKFREMYATLAKENRYIDFYSGEERREYQINSIFDNVDYNHEPSCTTIKRNYSHLCLRDKCPKYISNYVPKQKPKPARRRTSWTQSDWD